MIQEESQGAGVGNGSLNKTYISKISEVAGAIPSTGTYSYYGMDHLNSIRGVYDSSKTSTGAAEFTPFGSSYANTLPAGIAPRYTVHQQDATSGLYYAKFRYYSPDTTRWMKRDPLGMVDGPNVYSYVVNKPTTHTDPLGLEYGCKWDKSLKNNEKTDKAKCKGKANCDSKKAGDDYKNKAGTSGAAWGGAGAGIGALFGWVGSGFVTGGSTWVAGGLIVGGGVIGGSIGSGLGGRSSANDTMDYIDRLNDIAQAKNKCMQDAKDKYTKSAAAHQKHQHGIE